MPTSGGSTGTPATAGSEALTLGRLEQEVARRLGPYRQLQAASSPDTTHVVVTALTTSRDVRDAENLYLLRRGKKADGTAVSPFTTADRVRVVAAQTASTGTLEVDRAWTNAPVATELLELHHLDPENELRPAVLEGLTRCWFKEHRASITLSSNAAERDLTALLSWVTDPQQVEEVEYVSPSPLYLPGAVAWFRPYHKAGSVWLATNPDPYPQAMLITGRRQHFAYVNGITQLAGPSADDDVLWPSLEKLNYLAAAGHIEAWRYNGPRLLAAAATGYYLSQQAAADEFTAQAKANYPRKQARMSVAHPRWRSRREADEVVY